MEQGTGLTQTIQCGGWPEPSKRDLIQRQGRWPILVASPTQLELGADLNFLRTLGGQTGPRWQPSI